MVSGCQTSAGSPVLARSPGLARSGGRSPPGKEHPAYRRWKRRRPDDGRDRQALPGRSSRGCRHQLGPALGLAVGLSAHLRAAARGRLRIPIALSVGDINALLGSAPLLPPRQFTTMSASRVSLLRKPATHPGGRTGHDGRPGDRAVVGDKRVSDASCRHPTSRAATSKKGTRTTTSRTPPP